MTLSTLDIPLGEELIFRTFVEQADDGIFIASPDGVYLHVNRSGHRMLGYEDRELLGKKITDLLQEKDLPQLAPSLNRIGLSDVYLREWTLIRKDKSLFQAEIMTQRLGNGFLLATVRDRSERLREEGQLREMFERLQKIASQLPGVVFQFKLRPDGTCCFPYASDHIRQIYRVSPDEVREDASRIISVLHPEDLESTMRTIKQSADFLQPWQHEYRVKFPDGVVRWLYGSSVPEKAVDGCILWHGFITDITERKEEEARKQLLEAQLQQSLKVESIGRLAGGVAHDFNNLLTSILGFAELAMEEVQPGSRAAEHLQQVLETGKRGAALTQQLLAFARKKIIKPEALDLSVTIRELLPMIERLLGEDIELQLNTAEPLGTVMMDVCSLEQVVVNLLVNARDAMPMGGRLSIETGNCQLDEGYSRLHADVVPGEYVLLAVSDTGHGMSSEIRQRLFEPFFTTKAPGHGTGLGLATCFGIVKQAGGHIAVYTEVGEGSTFRVYLPRVGGKARQLPSQATGPTLAASGEETILIVEDDGIILQLAREALSRLGYSVLVETNGARALEFAARYPHHIDLLFTDVVMPKMDGKELATRLGMQRKNLKVLFTSGHTEDTIVRRGVLEPGIEFIQKPYTLQGLAARIRKILDGA